MDSQLDGVHVPQAANEQARPDEEDHSERALAILARLATTEEAQKTGQLALRRAITARRICADGMYEAFLSAQLVADAVLADDLASYAAAVERRVTPLTTAGWGAKLAFDRFPRTTFALARLPVTFRAVERLLRVELATPGEARGLERTAVRAVYRVAKAAGA